MYISKSSFQSSLISSFQPLNLRPSKATGRGFPRLGESTRPGTLHQLYRVVRIHHADTEPRPTGVATPAATAASAATHLVHCGSQPLGYWVANDRVHNSYTQAGTAVTAWATGRSTTGAAGRSTTGATGRSTTGTAQIIHCWDCSSNWFQINTFSTVNNSTIKTKFL